MTWNDVITLCLNSFRAKGSDPSLYGVWIHYSDGESLPNGKRLEVKWQPLMTAN